MICAEDGGVLDDLVVYRLDEDEFLVIANASNTDVVFEAVRDRSAAHDARVTDATGDYALVAIQGPAAAGILAPLAGGLDLGAIRYYAGTLGEVAGHRAWVARTGYTGEDGFEVFCRPEDAVPIWRRSLRVEPGPAWSRPGWPLAIRSGLRPPCRCTATSSART